MRKGITWTMAIITVAVVGSAVMSGAIAPLFMIVAFTAAVATALYFMLRNDLVLKKDPQQDEVDQSSNPLAKLGSELRKGL